jgi:TPR repeat
MSGGDPNKWSRRQPDPSQGSGTDSGGAKEFDKDWSVDDRRPKKPVSEQPAAGISASGKPSAESSIAEKAATAAPRPTWNIVEEVEKRPAKGPGLGPWYITPLLIALMVFVGYRVLTDRQTIGTLKFVKDNKVGIVNSLAPWFARCKLGGVAEELYRSSYDANPKDVTPLLEVALLEVGEGKSEQAVKDLQEVLKTTGANTRVYIGLGRAYTELKQTDRALYYLNAAIALEPQSSEAWYNRALIYKSVGSYDMALHDLEIPCARNYGPAVYRRVEIYEALHRNTDAEQDRTRIRNLFLQDKP